VGSSGRLWPLAEGLDFPKQAVQAAGPGKNSHSLSAGMPDPYGPLENVKLQVFITQNQCLVAGNKQFKKEYRIEIFRGGPE
jgi:hypothetical protein